MDGGNNINNAEPESNIITDDFSLIDLVNEADIEEIIDLIRAENKDPIVGSFENYNEFYPNYDSEYIADHYFDDGQFVVPAEAVQFQEDLFDFEVAADIDVLDSFGLNTMVGDHQEENDDDEDDDDDDVDNDDEYNGEQSSAKRRKTMNGSKAKTKMKKKSCKKADRPRTIMSERKRRGKMKEKLYQLRALVPNITKMDKASIIGDAVLYVQDLQMQAKNLKTEIAGLESSLLENNIFQQQELSQNANEINMTHNIPEITKKIMQMEVLQAEEKGFYVRLVCNKGSGVIVSLYKAIESFSSFSVHNSNLITAAEDYILTFTVDVKECKVEMDLPNVRFWIASAFLHQGFDFETTLSV